MNKVVGPNNLPRWVTHAIENHHLGEPLEEEHNGDTLKIDETGHVKFRDRELDVIWDS